MIVARTVLVGDIAVLERRLEHHTFGELAHHATLDLLPGRLAIGHASRARRRQADAPARPGAG